MEEAEEEEVPSWSDGFWHPIFPHHRFRYLSEQAGHRVPAG
jgi:hypothetical protein